MPGQKKTKKDAKETGGVVAAVTKHATGKFTNGNQGFASDTSNPSAQSPGPSPDLPASVTSPSPMLEPVSSSAGHPSHHQAPRAIPAMAEWSRNGVLPPGLAGSPGNLISLMGDSPPTRWSSPRHYGTSHTSHTSHTSTSHMSHASHASHVSHASQATHPTSVSVSPPSGPMDLSGLPGRRPRSYHMDPNVHYTSELSTGTSPSIRRSSLHANLLAHSRANAAAAAVAAGLPSNPPLPHQPQAHFYGTPDLDLDLQPLQAGMRPGQRGYHFSFDSLPSSYSGQVPVGTDTVVTAGYEGGLEVHLVSKRGLEPLASLTGLRGGVYGAKILPWMAPGTAVEELFPLVAVVIHGPVLPLPDLTGVSDGNEFDGSTAETTSGASGTSSSPRSPQLPAEECNAPPIEFYQTTVEVYSLKQNRWLCTLLEAPKIPLKIPITSPIFQAPPPTGAFQIKADGGTVVVASATTGECWVYRQMASPGESGLPFRNVAKLWTTLQQPPKGDATLETERARAAAAAMAGGQTPRHSPKQPVLSLSGRWLAYCPATPSSQIALRAAVPVAVFGRAPGYASLTPPQLPPVTAEIDLPQSESVMNKIMRDATQEIISGAKWVGQQGWQAFNNYWKGGAGASTPQPPRSPPSIAGYASRGDAAQFPPTHSAVPHAAISKEPGLVSVVDVTALGGSANVHPLATFSPPLGCSFLSFSPTGFWLFTASTKGDVQTVWDLLRIQYTKASPLQAVAAPGVPVGSRVRQIAQFSRMTVARIVDVAWTKPNGERLAMVTERGTVHILDLPSAAFTWPPPRRRMAHNAAQEAKASAAGGGSNSSSGGGGTELSGAGRPASIAVSYASSALTTAFDAARPLLARPRRSSANVPQSTGATLVDHASHGGKMIAAGISHSLGKTGNAINQLRHTGESRVSLPPGSFAPGPACVVWVTGKRTHSLFVLGDGLVRSFASRSRRKTSGQRMLQLSLNKDMRLPNVSDDVLAEVVKQYLEPEEYLDFVEPQEVVGSNTMVLLNRQRLAVLPSLASPQHPPKMSSIVESSIPQAEIESSAPYQPFHTDKRVSLYEYDVPETAASMISTVATGGLSTLEAGVASALGLSVPMPVPVRAATPLSGTVSDVEAVLTENEDSSAPSALSTSATSTTLAAVKSKRSGKKMRIGAAAVEALRASKQTEQAGQAEQAEQKKAAAAAAEAKAAAASSVWAFGQPIAATLVTTGYPGSLAMEGSFNFNFDETRALPASAMERVLQRDGDNEQIVVTTRRRRGGGRAGEGGDEDEDGFFEDDCEVLDFADQRV